MAFKIKRTTRNTEKLIKKLEKLSEESVSTGYYPEQGYHTEYNMTYANLMSIHETGKFGMPVRPVRWLTTRYMKNSYQGGWSLAIKKYLQGKQGLKSSLHEIGIEAAGYARGLFGKSPPLEVNSNETIVEKGANTPLVDTGELRDKWGYKVGDAGVITNVSYS